MQKNQTIFSPMGGRGVSVAYTGTAGTTSALADEATAVSIVTTTDAFVRVNGTAAANVDLYVPSGCPVVLEVNKGATISAVQVSSGGTLYAMPLA